MRYVVLGSFLAAFVPAVPAHSQPAQAPAAAQTSVSNDEFRRLALMAESFDFESSRLALTQATRASVKRYAASLMGNFRFDYARLASGATIFSSIPALPADPNATPAPFSDPRRAAMLNQLSTATGRDFQRLYLDMQKGTRQETLGLYEAYVRSGSDPALLAFARERLPLLQQQLQVIRRLAGS
jgi:putative membrane protein